MDGELLSQRTAFFTGDYKRTVDEGEQLAAVHGAAKSYLWRALAITGNRHRIDALWPSSRGDRLEKALRIWSDAYEASRSQSSVDWQPSVSRMDTLTTAAADDEHEQIAVVAASFYLLAKQPEMAASAVAKCQSLEGRLVSACCLARMRRLDLASQTLESLKQTVGDDVAVQAVEAGLGLVKGTLASKDALYTFQELAEVNGKTALLLNGQAAACLLMGRLEEAESLLAEAIDLDPQDADVLANSVVCALHRGKPESLVESFIAKLGRACPTHRLLAHREEKRLEFKMLAAKFRASSSSQ